MKQIRIHALSLGCPKNRVDTERLLGAIPNGVRLVDDPNEAQVVLINTCSFIQPAVEESVAAILDMESAIEEGASAPCLWWPDVSRRATARSWRKNCPRWTCGCFQEMCNHC